jgi:hypothetical protein
MSDPSAAHSCLLSETLLGLANSTELAIRHLERLAKELAEK